ncbi:hypothetical protein LCGC14_1483070 [marine sediment metagenome]|uniref:VRR-NUC domain-containing protein n=1 Tax=marine sediment metagenome TaxID=412755 RepID=A0A0F9LPE7_9ZZZZ
MTRANPEFALQCAAAEFLSWALPDDIPYTHLPMGGKRDKATAGKLKAMGVNPGWPDFEILIPDGVTLRIEMKTEKGVLSKAQEAFHERAKALGHPIYIARSVARVQEILEHHDIILRARVV